MVQRSVPPAGLVRRAARARRLHRDPPSGDLTIYAKLFDSIVHSTIWDEEMHVKVVWVTMLAIADPKGYVWASVPGLAHVARVSRDQCTDALARLVAPDPDSRTKEHEGRRLEAVDGGWFVFNYEKYRRLRDEDERRANSRERSRRYRERHASSRPVTRAHASSLQSESESESESKSKSESEGHPMGSDKPNVQAPSKAVEYPEEFEHTWAIYPPRAGGNPKRRAYRAWVARRNGGVSAEEMHAGVERYRRYCELTRKIGTEYVKQAATFLVRARDLLLHVDSVGTAPRLAVEVAANAELAATLSAWQAHSGVSSVQTCVDTARGYSLIVAQLRPRS